MKMNQVLGLQQIYPKIKEVVLPIKTTYKLSKLFDSISKEIEFYKEQLNLVIDAYAVKDSNGVPQLLDDGSGIKIEPQFIGIAEKKINELLNLDIDTPNVSLEIDELDGLKLTIEEFNLFMPFIKE